MQPRILEEPLPVDEQRNGTKPARSFKVGVKTKSGEDNWIYNGLRFGFREHAERYAKDLQRRWADMGHYLVVASNESPNCIYPVPSDRYLVNRLDSKG